MMLIRFIKHFISKYTVGVLTFNEIEFFIRKKIQTLPKIENCIWKNPNALRETKSSKKVNFLREVEPTSLSKIFEYALSSIFF